MPHIHKQVPGELMHGSSEAFVFDCLPPACLCINRRSAAYIFSRTACLSHVVCALSFPSLCLSRSNSEPYLDFLSYPDTFFLICKVHPAPNSSPPVLPVSVGVKLAI